MKKSSIGVGLVFVFIGIIAILLQFGIVDFSILTSVLSFVFRNLTTVIAMILIVSGVNIIFRKYNFVKIITWLIFFAVIIVLSQYHSLNNKQKPHEIQASYESSNYFEIEKKDETLYGKLDVNLGAAKVKIDSTDDMLIKGNVNSLDFKEPKIEYKDRNKTADVKINESETLSFFDIKDFFKKESVGTKDSSLFLNEDILWNINLNLGAVDTEFDMTNLKIEKLQLNGGAGNFEFILGEKHEEVDIDINAGASNFNIYVPENSGIKVKNSGILNTLELNNISLIKEDKYYISDNFDDAENKIEIDITMGVGNITINTIEE